MINTKCKASYGKAMVVALCALLFAVCFMAVALSTPKAKALANANLQLSNIDAAQKAATPRVLNGDVSYTVDGNTTPQTGTLDAAIQAINGNPNGGTITLTQNVEIDSSSITRISKDTTLDLGTYTLAFRGGSQIDLSGTANLTVTGTTGILTNSASSTINHQSSGTLNVIGGTIKNTIPVGNEGVAINISNSNGISGVVNISGEKTKVTGERAIENNSGIVNISGGTVETTVADAYGIYNTSTNTDSVNITGGTVTATAAGGYGIYNNSTGAVTVSGGTVSAVDATTSAGVATGAGIYNKAGGTVTVKGGVVKTALSTGSTANSGAAIFNEADGKIIVTSETTGGTTTSGTVTTAGSEGMGIFNKGKGTVTVSGGSISGGHGIYTHDDSAATGLIAVSGGEITVTGHGIYSCYGPVNITGGTVESLGYIGNYAIYLSNSANLTISGNATVVKAKNSAIFKANSNATIDISGGTVSSESGYVIEGYGGTLIVSDGKVEVKDSSAAIYHAFTKVTISGGEITSATGAAIDNTYGNPLYLSGTPTITGGGGVAIITNVATNGAGEDGTKYTGEKLTINYTGTITGNPIIVNNNSDTSRFTLYNAGYGLKVSGDNLVAETEYNVTFNYNGVLTDSTIKIVSGETVAKPTTAVTGFVVVGWYTDNTTFQTEFDFNNTITDNKTLYAKMSLAVDNLADVNMTYNGTDQSLTVVLEKNDLYNYAFAWTLKQVVNGSDDITDIGTDSDTLTYKKVSQSGNYTCVITATPKSGTGTVYTATKTVNITINNTTAYIAFMNDTNTAAIGYDPETLTYEQYSDSALKAMLEAYKGFTDNQTTSQLELDQITDAGNTEKIENLQTQYTAITEAKATAETALAKLGADSAKAIETIRKDGITAFENNVPEATAAVQEYTDLSSGLKATDLTGGEVLADANNLIADYKAKLVLANTAITTLNDKTAQGIKAGTYAIADLNALIAAAETAYNDFYAAGGDVTDKHPDLVGYNKIAQVKEEIEAYEGYKTFYDEYKTTWETALDSNVDKAKVDAMETAYNNLSDKSKALLDAPEQKAIEDAIAKYVPTPPAVDSTNNTVFNTAIIGGNVLLGLTFIAFIVCLVKRNNAKKKDDTTQNN